MAPQQRCDGKASSSSSSTSTKEKADLRRNDGKPQPKEDGGVAVDWTAAHSVCVEWDDGHIPEPFQPKQQPDQQQYMRIYPDYHNDERSSVHVVDDMAPCDLADAVYNFTASSKREHGTWGSYVTMEEIQEYWKSKPEEDAIITSETSSTQQQDIALRAASSFILNAVKVNPYGSQPWPGVTNCNPSNEKETCSKPPLWTDDDCSRAHGVAVWALASNVGSEVPYHLDYAELLRYETGVIVPPVLAGTWHCSRTTDMFGGDYCVHKGSGVLQHYRQHGYKGALSTAGTNNVNDDSDTNWILIPYRFNRMICQSGHLPHLSTKVESMMVNAEGNGATGMKRVIVGFNVFLHDVGPFIQEAPEHSEAFRKRVRGRAKQQTLSLAAVTANPRLSRLLVLAKREKFKKEFAQAQNDLDEKIQNYLMQQQERMVSVQQLLDAFEPAPTKTEWPYNVNDVHVHIHHRSKEGMLHVAQALNVSSDATQLVGADCLVELPK